MKFLQRTILPITLMVILVTSFQLQTKGQENLDLSEDTSHLYLPLVANVADTNQIVQEESNSDVNQSQSPNYEPVHASATGQPSTGIWYSTWYAKKGNYIWAKGHGQGSASQMLGDVNGDGKADALVYFAQDGSWYTALSTGSKFDGYNRWINGHGVGSSMQLLSDVNADGKADAVVYFAQDGSWYVALSNGSGFNAYSRWINGHGVGSTSQLLRDVNGDGKADAVVYFGNDGSWWVALSNGTGFNGYSRWIQGHGVSSTKQLLSDVTGDSKADAVVYFGNEGSWYVAVSSGSSFNGYSRWIGGHGVGSATQMLEDITGDGKSDAVVYFSNNGFWYSANSTGTTFSSAREWKYEHGQHFLNPSPSSWQGLGKVLGGSKAAPVAYYGEGGIWKILPSDTYTKPNMLNTWEAWNIKYVPFTLGEYRTYDTSEVAVIDEHLRMMAAAKIDFLIFDETNDINADYGFIKAGAKAVCERIKVWNSTSTNRPIKYAIAIGRMQFDANPSTTEHETDPKRMEDETKIVWDEFVGPCGPSNYYNLNGKPLLVSYVEYKYRHIWETWTGDKTNANRFAIRWIQGKVPGVLDSIVPASQYGLYFGWGYPQGAMANTEVMVVMPGWNNGRDTCVSRVLSGTEGRFYSELGWQRVLTQKPNVVIINSFNEYAEQTAIAPTDTSLLVPYGSECKRDEKWLSPQLYWDMTVSYNALYQPTLPPTLTPTATATRTSVPVIVTPTPTATRTPTNTSLPPTPTPSIISNPQTSNDATTVTYQYKVTGSFEYYRVYIDTDQNVGTGFQVNGIGANYLVEGNELHRYSGTGTNWQWTFVKLITYNNTAGTAKWTILRSDIGETATPNQSDLIFQVETVNVAEHTSAKYTHVFGTTTPPTATRTATPIATATTTVVTRTVTYSTTTALFPNPERGFYRYFESRASSPDLWTTVELSNTNSVSWLSAAEEATITQIYCLFYLDNFRRSNISQEFLNHIQTNLNAVRSVGRKCILRFAYTDDSIDANGNGIPDILQNSNSDTEPQLDQLLAHIIQLKPILQANADVITVLQAGFIGLWGEWYYTDYFVDDPSNPDVISNAQYDRRKAVVTQLLDALPFTRTIAVRYPVLKKEMFDRSSPITSGEAFTNTPLARIGYHNDALLNSYGDSGTFQSDADRTYLQAETIYLPMGGEVNSPEAGAPSRTCTDALREMKAYHWSYINTDYYVPTLQNWKSGNCIHNTNNITNSILDRLGYRLVLKQGIYPITAQVGGRMNVRFTLVNEGFAAPYNQRNLFLMVRNTSTGQVYSAKLPDDPRRWLATGQTFTISRTVTLPSTLPAGQYSLAIHLADPSPSLSNRPEYAIRFANTNLWRSTSGWNDLGHVVTVTSSVSSASGDEIGEQGEFLEDEAIELVEAGILPEESDPIALDPVETVEPEQKQSVYLPLITR